MAAKLAVERPPVEVWVTVQEMEMEGAVCVAVQAAMIARPLRTISRLRT